MFDKDEAQRTIRDDPGPRPGSVYRHYKGGLYSIVCESIDEATGQRLVTYHSNAKGTCWTRTLANFTETVIIDDGQGRVRRFVKADH